MGNGMSLISLLPFHKTEEASSILSDVSASP